MEPPISPLVKITRANNPKYYGIFQQFEHFSNYIHYAIEFQSPEIWVDDEAQPTLACFYTAPAWFLWGDPDARDATPLLELLPADGWLIPSTEKWHRSLTAHFGERLTTHPRASFDSASLNLAHLRRLKSDLPAGLRIVPIDETHVNDQDGMLYQDLLSKFFTAANFIQQGAGFCLLDNGKIVGFAAANYPIRNQVLEVYIRVDYNDDPRHRQKGLGTQLGVALLEYCLEHGLDPQWDAANDISVRLALKLGYTPAHNWKMHHLQD
jgi:GNAT superfamily N-acetyltransferase